MWYLFSSVWEQTSNGYGHYADDSQTASLRTDALMAYRLQHKTVSDVCVYLAPLIHNLQAYAIDGSLNLLCQLALIVRLTMCWHTLQIIQRKSLNDSVRFVSNSNGTRR